MAASFLGGRRPAGPGAQDFRTTVRAVLGHDVAARLPGLRVPTLLVGGADDPFFPDTVLRGTADAIPEATLRVLDGGHGVPKQRAGALHAAVATFLEP